ncbi:MAG: hypothetical protein JO352_05960 [Chloroflexi bacterium]|nr:hypothetical protein [Chloroflexota bacterium]MBV9596093.1 hypothetical protein [Chloroflexota bacterium]
MSDWFIMNQTGHRSLAMIRGYIREGELFRDDNAARAPACSRPVPSPRRRAVDRLG